MSGYGAGNPFSSANGHLRFRQDGADALFEVDIDGGGDGYSEVARLLNVDVDSLSAWNTSVKQRLTGDYSKPEVNFVSSKPSRNGFFSELPQLYGFSAEVNSQLQFSLDGQNWLNESPLVDQDGTYTLHVRELVNGAPVENSQDSIDFTIDRIAPNTPSLATGLSAGVLKTEQSSTTITGESEGFAEITLLRDDGSVLASTTATEYWFLVDCS